MLFIFLLISQFICSSLANNVAEQYKNLLRDGDNHVMGGRSKYQMAIASYTKAVDLQPGDIQAILRRAEVHSLMKNYREAERDLKVVLSKEPGNKRALNKISLLYISIGEINQALQNYNNLIQLYQAESDVRKVKSSSEIVEELAIAEQALLESRKDPRKSHNCITAVTSLLERIKDSTELLIMRVECAINVSQHDIALSDLRKLMVMAPSNTKVLFLHALQYKSLGALEQTSHYIKRCFSIDPENKNCHKLSKELKNSKRKNELLEKYTLQKNWSNIISHITNWLQEAEMNDTNIMYEKPSFSDLKHKQCSAHFELRETKEGLLACSEALKIMGEEAPGAWEIHLLNADLHAQEENFQAAVEEVEIAKRKGGNQQKIHEMASKLEKLKQQASRKNYYKILGVPKNASKKAIRKAFRALALKYHPDKVTTESEAERERLASVYRDINEAKEVLLDDDKRQRYDQGEDVFGNNAQAHQQQQQQDPFSQFMNGGFRFHFN